MIATSQKTPDYSKNKIKDTAERYEIEAHANENRFLKIPLLTKDK